MPVDRTQQQTPDQIKSSEDLSRKPKRPPAQVTGYAIESLLGSGAYGEVWMALDQKTGRRVAIKFYTRQTSLDFSLLSREVEKLVFLSADRYVVQLLDVGWDASPPYYVMDYIDNGSLEDELNRNGRLPVDEAVELTEEISIGLMHLHGKGILHCDLKPGNVLLDQDKKPRLADFGQSRLSHEQAPALGTLFFMAPEQADLKAGPDARWDVYALGALLYCMLTGHPPFRDDAMLDEIEAAEDIEDRLRQYRRLIQNAPRPSAHKKIRGVDRSLAEIIDRCISRNPKNRFASVQSVLQALRQRDLAHAKRPLFILGLVGPLLLLAVTTLFAWNAYQGAISQSDQSITRKTLEINHWVAQLAARSAAEQIDNYFRVVNQVAQNLEFRNLFLATVENSDLRKLIDKLSDPHDNENPDLEDDRNQFVEDTDRLLLQQPLLDALGNSDFPKAASWFVCDHTGTQIASVFNQQKLNQKKPANTIGKNYSYRSYFNGQHRNAEHMENGDLVYDVNESIDQRQHISRSHMSAIFISKATKTWKVAFSTPIFEGNKFKGIIAVTAEMGFFIDFDNGESQYVMLVDGRHGDFRGSILEHPLLDQLGKNKKPIPERISRLKVGDDVLSDFDANHNEINSFTDPMGKDQLGADFDQDWIAAWADVKRKISSDKQQFERQATGLKVVAVEDRQSAMTPSRRLGRQLAWMGTIALTLFLLVTGGLLFVVSRSLRKSREKAARVLGMGANGTNSVHEISTVMASGSTPTHDK